MLDDFWDDYETFSDNASNSNYKFFANALTRWFALLDGQPIVAKEIARLEKSMDFNNWFEECEETSGSMAGSAALDFPIETDARLGAHLYLLRKAAADDHAAVDLAQEFLSGSGDLDTSVREFSFQIFQPARAELRKYLQRRMVPKERPIADAVGVPASDRVVPLDHNSNAYAEAIESLNKIRDAVAESNEYDDQNDREQRVAELDASRVLLGAPQVRIAAVQALTMRCLKYLGEKFVEGIIAALVTAAIVALANLFGYVLF